MSDQATMRRTAPDRPSTRLACVLRAVLPLLVLLPILVAAQARPASTHALSAQDGPHPCCTMEQAAKEVATGPETVPVVTASAKVASTGITPVGMPHMVALHTRLQHDHCPGCDHAPGDTGSALPSQSVVTHRTDPDRLHRAPLRNAWRNGRQSIPDLPPPRRWTA